MAKAMITVHHLNQSRAQRILWLLEELGAPYEIVHYQRDPQTLLAPPALKAIHPLGKSPVVQIDGEVLAESGAIIETLAERDASEARLRLLQSQLEPHMLFNTLANLRALIGVDPPAAQRMVDRLNDYLRATLDASRATTHPLSAEFERLRDYLDLMAIRMGPRLAASFDLPDALRDVPVPPLILQPLVENAIRHGLEPQVAGGRIDVHAAREGDALVLTVHDSGAGFDATQPPRSGRFGMAQVIERVASATSGRGTVDVQSQSGAGTTVRLTLPLQEDPS